MNNTKVSKIFGATIFFAVLSAQAQTGYVRPAYQYPGQPPASGPASIQMGTAPFFITPYLGLGLGYDDNIFLTPTNEKSSTLYLVSPGFVIDGRDQNSVVQIRHQTQFGLYRQSEDDNYTDHTTRAQFDLALDRRNFLRLAADHVIGHDPRGSTDRPLASRPDRYRLISPGVTYAFGAPGAAGRIEAYGSYGRKRYMNNRQFTAASDRDTTEYGSAFYWRAMPRTYVLVEARQTDIEYRTPGSPFSAEERRYYAGLAWDATAATTGTVKIGRLERKHDFGPEFDATSWEALITWAPRTYSKFDLYSARQTNESTGLGNFILTSVTGVTWTHNWSSVLSTGVDARFQKDKYQGFDRQDDLNIVGLKVGYRFRRWLTFGAEYTHTTRDSNRPNFEYDKNLYLLSATLSM
jgi:polysaccharide biosynthesis protein VpsM